MASKRDDPYLAVVCDDNTGQRFQFVGSKKEVEEQAAQKVKELGKKVETRIIVERRA